MHPDLPGTNELKFIVAVSYFIKYALYFAIWHKHEMLPFLSLIKVCKTRNYLVLRDKTHGLYSVQWDVLSPNLVESRNREIGCYINSIALKFARHFGSTAADVPVEL